MKARTFTERLADDQRHEALETLTLTERLLAHVLIELMDIRRTRNQGEIAERFRMIGLSSNQIAALLETTPASLAVSRRRATEDEPSDGDED